MVTSCSLSESTTRGPTGETNDKRRIEGDENEGRPSPVNCSYPLREAFESRGKSRAGEKHSGMILL